MSIRIKMLLVIGLTFLAFLGILYFTTRWFLLHDANISEDKSSERDVTRLLAVLDGQFAVLDSTVSDWAEWDDTYNFILNRDQAYIDSNLPDSEFTSLNVELMLFIDSSGNVVFGKLVDHDTGLEIPLPKSLSSELQVGSPLLSHKEPSDKLTGILALSDGPMIISSQAIVNSQGEGPIRGTLIMGRRLNENEIGKLAQTTLLTLSVFPYNAMDLPKDVLLARNSLNAAKPIFVADQSETVESGYTIINDVYGNPALILRVNNSRDAFTQANTSVSYLGWALLSIGIALCLVTMFLVERMVLTRVTNLSSSVMKISSHGTASSRVEASGNDEIFTLATSLNSMLDSLQVSREKERESDQRYSNLTNISPVGIFHTDQTGATTYVNPMYCKISGLSVDEALGLGWVAAVHPEDRESLTKVWQESLSLNKSSLEYFRFVRRDGTIAWVMAQAIPEINAENHVVGYVGTITDITGRKQAEAQVQSQVETLGTLYNLSRGLAATDDFNGILELLTRQAAEATHVTFSCVLIVENGDLVVRGIFPVRALDHDLQLGLREPLAAHPVCQRILEEYTPRLIQADSAEAEDCTSFFLGIAQTLCIVPLRTREHPLGLLLLGEARAVTREPFTEEKIHLARSIGDQASSTLHRALLYEATVSQLDQLQSLHDIDRAISGSVDLRMTLSVILEQTVTQLKVDAAGVLLLNPHTQTLEYAAGRGFHTQAYEHTHIRLGESQAGLAALERRIIQLPDFAGSGAVFTPSRLMTAENVAAYFVIPLIAKGEVKGVMEIFQHATFNPDPAWLNFFETLAGQAAIAIDSAQLFDNLQRSNVDLTIAYDRTIEGWSHALDLRDKETEGHTLRVAELAERLARSAGVAEAELIHIRRGALLHDIGKMGVPDGVLLKPDKLTDEEWVLMRHHPQFAFDMLSPIAYLKPALDIPYCHHEKWDGTGYPRELKGEQIPLAARLFAVVDVWDALLSDRPYRPAWTEEKVIEHIKAGSGTHFDPKAVQLFLKMISEDADVYWRAAN